METTKIIIDNMIVNNHFIIIFKPKRPELFNNRKRFGVGAGSLAKYIGDDNAKKLLNKIGTFVGDDAVEKYVLKYRKMGTIILYAK